MVTNRVYPNFMYMKEHLDLSQFEKGHVISYVQFWAAGATDEEITRYLESISDKFLPGDGQKLVAKTWGRQKGHRNIVIVRVVYEVNP